MADVKKGILWATVEKSSLEKIKDRFPWNLSDFVSAKHFHVTLQFGIEKTPEIEALLGKPVTIKVREVCWNDKIVALPVVILEDITSSNEHPHVTWAMKEGTPPYLSNEMLAGSHHSATFPPLMVEATIEFLEW